VGITLEIKPNEALKKLNEEIKLCRNCLLYKTRIQAVPGEGNLKSDLMFIGEAPGAQEDSNGLPFVGIAGKWFNELLAGIGLKREEVYVTNLIKCRPPANRNPLPAEIKACLPFLKLQLKIIQPKMVCSLGSFAFQALAGENLTISQARGKVFHKGDLLFFASYHPAAALYTQKLKEVMREDFKKLKELLEKDHRP
jgi:uracil-DNA glycosylase